MSVDGKLGAAIAAAEARLRDLDSEREAATRELAELLARRERAISAGHAASLISLAVERSRSGEGAHIWFFFSEPVQAALARRFGLMLLTDAMARSPTLGMASYDRLFPSQDTLPKGGFGNLIALPLQQQARRRGNTLFVDEHLEPFEDQWSYLESLPRIAPPRDQHDAVRPGSPHDRARRDPFVAAARSARRAP